MKGNSIKRGQCSPTPIAAREVAAELEQLPPPTDSAPLTEIVRAACADGDLCRQAAELHLEIESLSSQAAIGLRRLELWSGPLEEIESLAVPSAETIVRFDRTLAEAQALVARRDRELEKARADAADSVRQLEQLRLEGDVPSEADLLAAREVRGGLWRLVRSDWIENKEPPSNDSVAPNGTSPKAHFGSGRPLADEFERSVRHADDLGDRLRREANRVARRGPRLPVAARRLAAADNRACTTAKVG